MIRWATSSALLDTFPSPVSKPDKSMSPNPLDKSAPPPLSLSPPLPLSASFKTFISSNADKPFKAFFNLLAEPVALSNPLDVEPPLDPKFFSEVVVLSTSFLVDLPNRLDITPTAVTHAFTKPTI